MNTLTQHFSSSVLAAGAALLLMACDGKFDQPPVQQVQAQQTVSQPAEPRTQGSEIRELNTSTELQTNRAVEAFERMQGDPAVKMQSVRFAGTNSDLSAQSMQKLDEFALDLQQEVEGTFDVTVTAFSDTAQTPIASEADMTNFELAVTRAENVKAYLQRNGVEAENWTVNTGAAPAPTDPFNQSNYPAEEGDWGSRVFVSVQRSIN